MKAAFRTEGKVHVRQISLPPLQPGQIRLKVAACGICGTDLLENEPQAATAESFGHEVAGTILEIASPDTRLRVGQKVVLDSSSPCGACDACRNARQELCTNIQSFCFLGSLGMAEEMIAPAISAIPYEDLDPAVACLQEPLGVAIDMVRLGEIGIDSNVVVSGLGPIGLMALALARRAGARRVFAVQPRQLTTRFELARRFGADDVIDPSDSPLEKHDFGCEIDRFLFTSPPRTLTGAFAAAAKGAIISFVGIQYGPGAFCTFDVNAFHFKKLQLRASFASPALFGDRALQYLREGVVDGASLITHRFPLDRVAEAMTVARTDPSVVKVVVEP